MSPASSLISVIPCILLRVKPIFHYNTQDFTQKLILTPVTSIKRLSTLSYILLKSKKYLQILFLLTTYKQRAPHKDTPVNVVANANCCLLWQSYETHIYTTSGQQAEFTSVPSSPRHVFRTRCLSFRPTGPQGGHFSLLACRLSPDCYKRFTQETFLNSTIVACRVKISQSEALKLLSSCVCVCVCVCVNRQLKCLHKGTYQGPVYLYGRMIHGAHYTTLCLNHPESYVIPRVGNLTERKVLYVNICHTANMVTSLKFWNYPFRAFCFIFIL